MDLLALPLELDLMGQGIEDLAFVPWAEHKVDPSVRAPSQDHGDTESIPNGSLSLPALQTLVTSKQSKYVSLNLHDNQLRDLHALPFLPSVRELNLSSNRFRSVSLPELVSQLPSLTVLDLSCNQISSLAGMPFLPRLKTLSLSFNTLSDTEHIAASLPNLENLDLRGNRLQRSADLDGLEGLRQLRTLSLAVAVSITPTAALLSQSTHNSVCQRLSNVVRLFHRCESLRLVDEKSLSQWEELFQLQERARERQAQLERETLTPQFDKVAQRFRELHTSRGVDRGRETDREPERSRSFSSSSSRSQRVRERETDRKRERQRERYFDRGPSLSPTQSRVLFPPRSGLSHTHSLSKSRRPATHRESERYAEDESESESAWPAETETSVVEEMPPPAPQNALSAAQTDALIVNTTAERVLDVHDEETQTERETERERLLLTLVSSLTHISTAQRTRTLCWAFHRLAVCCAVRRESDAQRGERTAVCADYERRLLTERHKHEHAQRRVFAQETQLVELRKECETLQETLRVKETERANYDVSLEEKERRLCELQEELSERERVLSALREECMLHTETAEMRESAVSELQAQLAEKERERYEADQRQSQSASELAVELSVLKETLSLRERECERLTEREKERERQREVERARSEADSMTERQRGSERALTAERERDAERERCEQIQQRLEKRLLKMQLALDELSATNASLQSERETLTQNAQRDKHTIKDLSKCVKKLQEIIDFRRDNEKSAKKMENEKDELQREMERERHERELRERERLRGTADQLSRLEERLHELQASKQQLETALAVKEVVMRDQAQELQQWRERQSSLMEELSLSRQEHRMESNEHEEQLRALEEENILLLQRIAAKERIEKRIKGLVREHLLRQSHSSSVSDLSTQSDKDNFEDDHDDLAMLLESVDWTAVRQSQESLNNENDTARARRGAAGIADLATELASARKKSTHVETPSHNGAAKTENDLCANKSCQERIQKLQRLAVEYQEALQEKNEECAVVSEALNRLERKTKDIADLMAEDKKEYEKTIEKYRADKKKLTKLCKALEDELARKDEELNKINAILTGLRTGPSPLDAHIHHKSRSSSKAPLVTVSSPPLRPPSPPK